MIRRFQVTAAVLLLLPSIAASKSGIIQVTGLRSWSHPGSTRVVIETSGPAEYHADRASNPERLFFDIPHERPWIAQHRVATHAINDQLVKRVRIAETAPGTTRVVFDLVGNAEFKVSRLDTPDRLVIELTHAGGEQIPEASLRREPGPGLPGRVIQRAFTPPVFTPEARMILGPPSLAATLDTTEFVPYQLPGSNISLASVRIGVQAAIAASAAVSGTAVTGNAYKTAAANTTTKVLPATRASATATAKASSNATLSLTRALGLKINRIVIDAGHGGHDDGTIGPHGVLEKDVVLDVALRLATLLQTRLGTEVVLTRSDDTFVPLTERTAIANEHKADLFLSIHANSSPAPTVAGTETFLLNFSSSPGATAVAARENAGSDKSVGELRDLVQSITLNDKIAESQTFATDIQSSIFTQAAKGNASARDRGVKKAPFVVLIGARMPSVLAEIGFLSNARDESNLAKPEYRQKIAESLYRGVSAYSQSLSHFEMAGTSTNKSGYSGTGAK